MRFNIKLTHPRSWSYNIQILCKEKKHYRKCLLPATAKPTKDNVTIITSNYAKEKRFQLPLLLLPRNTTEKRLIQVEAPVS